MIHRFSILHSCLRYLSAEEFESYISCSTLRLSYIESYFSIPDLAFRGCSEGPTPPVHFSAGLYYPKTFRRPYTTRTSQELNSEEGPDSEIVSLTSSRLSGIQLVQFRDPTGPV